ncbi:MAG: hypothetical protein QOD77_1908 [Thermoplasmata archaeon]|jgi:hypothetical protein|nr:hypothetical protein [Thermoplasmata archaeon]
MRTWTAYALVLLLAGLPAASVGQSPPNREPVADAGLDVSYAESSAPPWSPATNPQSEGFLDGTRSYDPDAADEGAEVLRFLYRPTPPPSCAVPCTTPAFVDITALPMIASTTPGPQCPDLQLRRGAEKGEAKFLIPNIPPGPQKACVYDIEMRVEDRDLGTDEQTVLVTILNDNQPPTSTLARPMSFLLGDTYLSGVAVGEVDIQGNHGKMVTLRATGLKDDKEVRSVQMRFCRPACGEGAEFVKDVPLVDKRVLPPPPAGELSEWTAPLPVDTPWLVVGEYTVELLVHDGEAGTLHIGGDATGVASLSVGAIESGQCATTPPSPGPCLFLESVAPILSVAPNLCFLGSTTQPPQALGVGQTLRPIVEAYLPQPEVYTTGPGAATEITDKGLMVWKVTYQTCSGLREAPGEVAVGTEIEVRYPYFLSLDTLFKGDQELKLRAYDRYGNPPTELVVPLTTDTATPQYLVDVPAVSYRGIPFTAVAYVHDRISTQVTLTVDIFNRTAAGKAVSYVNQTALGAAPGPNSRSFMVPPLHTALRTDMWGAHDRKSSCQYLFDLDGDLKLDMWFDPRNSSAGGLIAAPGKRATDPIDFVVDADDDGLAEPGEPLVPGAVAGVLKHKDTCLSPFQPPFVASAVRGRDLEAFLNSSTGLGTQAFLFELNRTFLGRTSYSFAIEDVVFNRDALPRYVFEYKVNGTAHLSPQNLTGSFVTEQAYVDAGIEAFHVDPKPYLPGDAVVLNVTMLQRSPLKPGPEVPLTLRLSDPAFANFTSPPLGPGDRHKLTLTRPFDLNVFKGNLTFAQQNEARQGFGPGIHVLRGNVTVPSHVEERGTANNTASTRFEVFLGKVVVGQLKAGDVATGEVFYVRAGDRGLPAEAVRLNDKAEVLESFAVSLDQTFGSPRYAFTYLKDGKPLDAYWDPQSRYDLANGHLCNQQADGDVAPKCRAVTVVGSGLSEQAEVDSPHVELLAVVAMLLGLALRRRK